MVSTPALLALLLVSDSAVCQPTTAQTPIIEVLVIPIPAWDASPEEPVAIRSILTPMPDEL